MKSYSVILAVLLALLVCNAAAFYTSKQLRQVIETLQGHSELTEGTRTRRTGTAGFNATIDYSEDYLQNLGFNVQRRKIDYDQYDYKKSTITVLNPEEYPKIASADFGPVLPVGRSAGGVVEAEAVGVPVSWCSVEDFGDAVVGKIALISSGQECGFDFTSFVQQQAVIAREAGAAAIIEEYIPAAFLDVVDQDTGLIGAILPEFPEPIDIPHVLTFEGTGTVLPSATDFGDDPVLRLQLSVGGQTSHVYGDSVIGTLPGNCDGECPVILISAHADSEKNGAGINDNGSGVAASLVLANRISKKIPQVFRKVDIVVALWAGEEDGLLGAYDYVDGMANGEVPTPDLVLNLDMVATPNGELSLNDYSFILDPDYPDYYYGGEALKSAVRGTQVAIQAWEDLHERTRLFYRFEDFEFTGSDHFAFLLSGVPSIFFHTGAFFTEHVDFRFENPQNDIALQNTRPDPCYHIGCDNGRSLDFQLFKRVFWGVKTFLASLVLNPEPLEAVNAARTAEPVPEALERLRDVASNKRHLTACMRVKSLRDDLSCEF